MIVLQPTFYSFFHLSSINSLSHGCKVHNNNNNNIIAKGKEDSFLDHINAVRPSIKFTMEREQDGKLPFLDCSLQRDGTRHIISKVYRKKTHTDRYLQYHSHHPVHVRRGVVKSLFDRAARVTSKPEDLHTEEEHLRNVFSMNGYPRDFVEKSILQAQNRNVGEQDQDREGMFVSIPYVSGLSEDIRRICRRYNIRVVFKPGYTIRNCLSRVKTRLSDGMQSKVVYSVPCSCGQYYVGETVRILETRIAEHKEACSRGELEKSAIEHAWQNQHSIEWGGTRIMDRASGRMELILKEALHIGLLQPGLNRDIGTELPGCWVSTIRALT